MEAIKIVEKPDKIMKEDFASYLKGAKAKQMLNELWPFIKLDSNGRILYNGDRVVAGSPLVDLIDYSVAKDRKKLERPFDIKKFWSILKSNELLTERVDKEWIILV